MHVRCQGYRWMFQIQFAYAEHRLKCCDAMTVGRCMLIPSNMEIGCGCGHPLLYIRHVLHIFRARRASATISNGCAICDVAACNKSNAYRAHTSKRVSSVNAFCKYQKLYLDIRNDERWHFQIAAATAAAHRTCTDTGHSSGWFDAPGGETHTHTHVANDERTTPIQSLII